MLASGQPGANSENLGDSEVAAPLTIASPRAYTEHEMKLRYAIGLLLATTAAAADLPRTAIPPAATPYDTEQAAATAAIGAAALYSTQFEYGGFIVQRGIKFYYSVPVTNMRPDQVNYTIAFSKLDTLIALYHTHPATPLEPDDQTEIFSGADITAAKSIRLHSYIGVFKDHTVREYIPGDPIGHGRMAGTDAPFDYARGRTIGAF